MELPQLVRFARLYHQRTFFPDGLGIVSNDSGICQAQIAKERLRRFNRRTGHHRGQATKMCWRKLYAAFGTSHHQHEVLGEEINAVLDIRKCSDVD